MAASNAMDHAADDAVRLIVEIEAVGDELVDLDLGRALESASVAVRTAVLGARGPLGGLLHQFAVPFQCTPAGFFEVSSALLPPCGTRPRRRPTPFAATTA